MEYEKFTKQEAQSKVGRRVKAKAPYAHVPVGTPGTVKKVERALRQFCVEIAWSYHAYGQCWDDVLDKDDYQRFVKEL